MKIFNEKINEIKDDKFESKHPVDIVDLIKNDINNAREILKSFDFEFKARVIEEIDIDLKIILLEQFEDEEQNIILENIEDDEIVKWIRNIALEDTYKIINKLNSYDREKVSKLLRYDEDTVGGIMNTEYMYVKEDMDVATVLRYLQDNANNVEFAYYVYVLNDEKKLKGVISLRELVVQKFEVKVSEVMKEDIISVRYDMDNEIVANILNKYSLLTIPVVDEENKMLGIVTVDDMMNIIKDEITEDMNRLNGIYDEETMDDNIITSIKSRLPWLLINLLTAIAAASVIGVFEDTLSKLISLATFMPIIAGMGGNAGTQTLTLMVRRIAIGELNNKNYKKVLKKELLFGSIAGLCIGSIISWLGYIYEKNIYFGVVIGISMLINLVIATLFGYSIPILLKKINIDPALASGVFVTAVTDIVGFFVFLGMATIWMKYLI